jgi:hypothetical protein
MKKVTVDKYRKADKSSIYIEAKTNCITLGNGVNRSFTNYKECLSFIANINKEINVCIDQINLMFMDVFREYRIFFRSLETYQAQNFSQLMHDIDNLVYRAISNSQSINGNHFTFHYLLKVCSMLRLAIEILVDRTRKLNYWHEKRTLEAMFSRVQQIEESLQSIGKEESSKNSSEDLVNEENHKSK